MKCQARFNLNRLWILPDIVKSSNLKVWCGPWECLYEDLLWVLHALYRDAQLPGARSPASAKIILTDEIRRRYQGREQITFAEVIQASRFFQCVDQRDRVIASMMIIGQRPVEPDYSSPITQFYTIAARAINSEIFPASLSMLEDVRIAASMDFPSWVPNLAVPVQRKLLIQRAHGFSASTNSSEQLKFDTMSSAETSRDEEHGPTLKCPGFVTDSLMNVFDYNPARQWYDERNLEALNNSFLAMWFDSAMLTVREDNEPARER